VVMSTEIGTLAEIESKMPERSVPRFTTSRSLSAGSSAVKRPGCGGGSEATGRWSSCRHLAKFSDEMRQRAKRMVREARVHEPGLSVNAACKRIGPQLGILPDTLRGWCKQADIDDGLVPGTTTSEREELATASPGDATRRWSCPCARTATSSSSRLCNLPG